MNRISIKEMLLIVGAMLLFTTEPLYARCGSHGGSFGPYAFLAPFLLKPLIVGLLLTSYRINFVRSFSWSMCITIIVMLALFLPLYLFIGKQVSSQVWLFTLLLFVILQIAAEGYLIKVMLKRLGASEEANRKSKIVCDPISVALVSNICAYALLYSVF